MASWLTKPTRALATPALSHPTIGTRSQPMSLWNTVRHLLQNSASHIWPHFPTSSFPVPFFPITTPGPAHGGGGKSKFATLDLVLSCPNSVDHLSRFSGGIFSGRASCGTCVSWCGAEQGRILAVLTTFSSLVLMATGDRFLPANRPTLHHPLSPHLPAGGWWAPALGNSCLTFLTVSYSTKLTIL